MCSAVCDRSITEAFDVIASKHRNDTAVELGGHSLTYGELDAAAERLARRLRALGVVAEEGVAVGTQRSIEAIVGFLAVLKAGGAYVPLDPEDPKARLELMIRDTGARVVLAEERFVAVLRPLAETVVSLGDVLDGADGEHAERVVTSGGNRLAYVMYTSGSTGRPKGVAIEHGAVVNRVEGAAELMPGPGDAMLQVSELDFDAQTWEIWGTLLNGGRLVIAPAGRPEPARIAGLIAAHHIDVALLSPGLFHQIVEADLTALAPLRLLLVGGDVMSPDHAHRFRAAHPTKPLVNLYGPTEVTVCCTAYRVEHPEPGVPVPIGQALGNTLLYVLDERGRQVDPGEIGELAIGGDCVARGYLNLPEATRERFVADPFCDRRDRRIYLSGDRVRQRADGVLEFLGRLDEQVKVRGFRIEPAEVEAALRAAPGVRQAAVVAREDVPGHKRLVAYVVGPDRGALDGVRRVLEQGLPAHMVPSTVVALQEMPLTSRGKIDRNALPSPLQTSARAAEGDRATTPDGSKLARIWAEVLHLDGVGVDDDFLELGGDSLLAIRVLVMVRESFSVDLPIDAVFEERTVARLAERIARARAEGTGRLLPPIESVDPATPVPVAPTQAEACLASEMALDANPYQFQALIWLDGELDVAALERALGGLIRRHQILRTRFPRRDGTWWQVVEPPFTVTLPVVDRRGAGNPDEAVDRLAHEAFRTRIAIDELPLVRWTLIRVADRRHVLVHVEHHLVHDGWSWTVFLRELVALYRAETSGTASSLCEPTVQFRDFTVWQLAVCESELGRRQLAYWSERLADLPPPIELASDRPRPPRQTYRGDQLTLELSPRDTERLHARARSRGVTDFMAMLSAFFVLLWRYSRQTDLVVGSGVASRPLGDLEGVIGMVLNTVALRVALSGEPTVGDLLERVRAATLEAYANQDVPFPRVVEAVAPPRRAGTSAIYQVLFSFQDPPAPDLDVPGLSVVPDDRPGNGSAKADLNVVVIKPRERVPRPDATGITVIWEYNTDLFDRETAESMLEAYRVVLDALLEDPERPISALPLTSPITRQHLLERSGRVVPYERDASIVELFERVAEQRPQAIALSSESGELRYRELDARANRLAHRLRAMGVDTETPVGVLLERSPDMVIALLAILKAGGSYVPLDPEFPALRVQEILDDARVPVVCTQTALRDLLAPGDASWQVLCVDDVDLGDEPADPPESRIGPTTRAYVAYTSGSTGVPKGVEVTHRSVVRLVRGVDYVDLNPAETMLALAPLAFDASTFEIWGALLNGARLVLAPPGRLSPQQLAQVVRTQGVTTMWLTSGLFDRFVDYAPEGLAVLHQLVAGGDVLSPERVNRALRLLPRGAKLVNGYGPTEGTTFTCCHPMQAGSRSLGPVPIGRPISNTHVYVVDERGQLLPPGVPGELWIGGDGVARGYLGRPDLTAERFVADPFGSEPGARLYRSGDLVRWRSDGTLEFLGRLDDQVKIRGVRVEPAEVERVLARVPGVREVAVGARGSRPNDRELVAYVVPAAGADVSVDALRNAAADRLPAQAVPAAWVMLESMPLTPNGKIDRGALPMAAAISAETPDHPRPTSPLEARMIEVWEEVLAVHPIGAHDDFFDLGGHSLVAVDLVAAIERRIGPRLGLSTIFEAPTPALLAECVRREGWEAPSSSLVRLTRGGSRPPFFCLPAGDANTVGYGALARHLPADQPFYALQPRGLDGRSPLQTRVEAMARHYLRVISDIEPDGPYLLGGRCLGGLVAYEIARRLEASGSPVALLVILDSLGPYWASRRLANGLVFDEVMNLALVRTRAEGEHFGDVFTTSAADDFVSWLRAPVVQGDGHTVNRYLHEAYLARPDVRRAYPNLEGDDAGRLVDWGWVSGRREMGMAAGLLPPATPAAAALRPPRRWRSVERARRMLTVAADWADVATRGRIAAMATRRQRRLQEIASRAAGSYRAPRYGGRIALVRSEEFLDDVEIARWHGVESGGVDEVVIRSTHRSMLREPDVTALAQCLEDSIDAALEQRALGLDVDLGAPASAAR